ncbi:MAG: Nramp family divalent metal transporter [Deltaproteobacteria bacterium]|nr:Nramp family divalent metal transporter [Deltaproteobacteria bacterium]
MSQNLNSSSAKVSIPVFPGLLKMLGPGIVWMAFAQGSGELIWWPYLTAKYGLFFLFLIIPAALLQYPIAYEIGRYTLCTGEGIWQGFIRLSKGFSFLLWLLMLVTFFWFGAYASAGGTALAEITGFPNGWSQKGQSLFWAYVSMAVFLFPLLLSRRVYRFIEGLMWFVAIFTVVGLIVASLHPSVLAVAPEFLRGLIGLSGPIARPWESKDAALLVTAITFMGLGGFFNLFYSYWLKEKGIGMARVQDAAGVSQVMADSSENRRELFRWLRFLRFDASVGIVGNLFTTLIVCLLAYAVLFPQGVYPDKWEIAVVQSRFFEFQWGAIGKVLFLFVAAAFLVDSWLTAIDGLSRINTDVVSHLFPSASKKTPRWWYLFFLLLFTVITVVTMPLAQPGTLILMTGILNFTGTVLYAIPLWILNYRWLPRQNPSFVRPSSWASTFLWISIIAYFVLMIAFLWVKFLG